MTIVRRRPEYFDMVRAVFDGKRAVFGGKRAVFDGHWKNHLTGREAFGGHWKIFGGYWNMVGGQWDAAWDLFRINGYGGLPAE